MASRPEYLNFRPDVHRISIDPHEPAFVQDPYNAYAFMHEAAPVFFWEEYGFWCASGNGHVNALLRDRRLGRENLWGAPVHSQEGRDHIADFDAVERHSLLEREPPVHARLRSLVNRAFVSRQVETLRPRVEQLAHNLIDVFAADRSVDLLPAFATPIPITVICELLGVPAGKADDLLSWSHAMCEMYVPHQNRETELRANRAAAEFREFLSSHISRHRSLGGDDLLSVLIAARDEGKKLSDDELVSTCVLLLNAGHEATVHQTGNAIHTILKQGGNPGRFFATPELAAQSVEECLRIDAPLHMFTRYAYEPVDLGPVVLEEGERVGLLLGAANNDPSAYNDPRTFDPGRKDQKNVSFGAGIHFCIGAPLARLEMQVALKVLFERLPEIKLRVEPRFRDSYHFHGLESLYVEW